MKLPNEARHILGALGAGLFLLFMSGIWTVGAYTILMHITASTN